MTTGRQPQPGKEMAAQKNSAHIGIDQHHIHRPQRRDEQVVPAAVRTPAALATQFGTGPDPRGRHSRVGRHFPREWNVRETTIFIAVMLRGASGPSLWPTIEPADLHRSTIPPVTEPARSTPAGIDQLLRRADYFASRSSA
jgi:hypothetical protein